MMMIVEWEATEYPRENMYIYIYRSGAETVRSEKILNFRNFFLQNLE